MMMNQETEEESGSVFIAAVNHQTTAVNPSTEQCNGSGSTKRKLQFPSTSPISKKPNLSPSPPSSSAQVLDGFKKIQLAPTTLRRTISEPIDSISNPSNIQSPESLSTFNLQRTLSDPTTALMFAQSPENYKKIMPPVTVTETTPTHLRSVLRRKVSDAMSSGKMTTDLTKKESPSSLELKKMKNNLRLMSQWFSQAFEMEDDQEEVDEEEEEVDEEEEEGFAHKTENPKENECHEIDEEAVSVDKTGECLIIKFKCPCSKAYHILLSGNSCYYKLI